MAFQVQGKLHKVFDIEQKTDSFQAREFILEITDSQYPQLIKFQLTQDKCGLIDDYPVGEELTVHFDLRGREWKERYFTNLSAWKLESGDVANASSANKEAGNNQDTVSVRENAGRSNADFDDDIPF